MTVRTSRFTPQALLSAPRRTAGFPNPAGEKVLYSTNAYSFDTHKKTSELRSLSIESGESVLLTDANGVSDPTWLDDSTFLVLKSGEGSTTDILVGSIDGKWKHAYTAATIKAPAGNLKISVLGKDKIAVVVSAKQDRTGKLFNEEEHGKNYSSARHYKSIYVRHWDEYATSERNTLWYTVLGSKDGKSKSTSNWVNLLKGKTEIETPISPFGGGDHFDVSSNAIIFVCKDPEVNEALNTKCKTYIADIPDFTKGPAGFDDVSLPGFDGAASSPVFSPDGTRAAFLTMRKNGYEADRNEIAVILDVLGANAKHCRPRHETIDSKTWDHSPSGIKFSPDGKSLFLIAEAFGQTKLWALAIDSDISGPIPRPLTHTGSVSEIVPLKSGKVFVSGSSLVDQSCYSIVVPGTEEASAEWMQSISRGGSTFGLDKKQVSSIWTPAAQPHINEKVHSWVFRPSFYDSSKKYPLAFIVHGGPQGANLDSWSTRWNPAVFAEQGYIVVTPNPTGSTGYGQAFTDNIRAQWGGAPYEDLVNIFSHIEANMPDVDTSRAVALGASYGGYMMNWINGHDLGRKFRALVCHDGIFSTANALSTDELYFAFHDLGGIPWAQTAKPGSVDEASFAASAREIWEKNDPARHLDQWATPMLVIHSSLDFRLPISEGLAAFNVLQTKGIDSEFLQFSDENHWVLKPENSLVWHKVVINFINRHVGLPTVADEQREGRGFFGGRKRDGEGEGEQDMLAMGHPAT